MTSEVVGRTALVTGAGGGIGRAIAEAFARRGSTIVVSDIEHASLRATCEAVRKLGGRAVAQECDVTDAASVHAMVQAAEEMTGGVDVLVNNAGVLYATGLDDITETEWDVVIDVNLKGTFLCSQAVLPGMRKRRWGRIVNISSSAGKNVSTVGGAHYTAAKAGVLGLTRHVAKYVAIDGITVNAVCPGLIDTDMVGAVVDDAGRQAYAASFPIGRLGTPGEVAEVVAFLATDRAAYITGASVDVNGGDLMI